MGLNFMLSRSCSCPTRNERTVVVKCGCSDRRDVNPDPFNFKVLRTKEWDYHLVAEVEYPNCTTFEGKKILVLTGITASILRDHITKLDPHFSPTGRLLARFRPDQWELACWFVGSLYK